ncbi:MAG: hypothetical protein HZA64_15035 [Rhodocyclales bacterium]|nr:hypothetical protein [Rhodocyclales bacterium]
MSVHLERMQSIQAMLAAGHRCVELERHSLLLWGLIGGWLCGFTDFFINGDSFPDNTQRAIAVFLWLAAWLGGMSWLDHRLTHKARLARAETLPFAQAQVTRAWWMLLAIGTLATFAMFFHGGGIMVYALWTVLLGLGMFVFGLFSRPLVEWIGLATILLGIAGLAAGLPFVTARWLTAAVFAVGLPFAGWLAARSDNGGIRLRIAYVTLWLVAVIAAGLIAARMVPSAAPPTPATATLKLPAGSAVPLYVDMESPLLAIAPTDALSMRVTRDTEVALTDGQPDGRYRFDGGDWHSVKDGILTLRIDRIRPQVTHGNPTVRMHGDFVFHGERR